jgi:cysteine synthase A
MDHGPYHFNRINMSKSFDLIGGLIGNTDLCKLDFFCRLYAKLEFQNLFGSIKDRPAYYILKKAIDNETINKDTIVIESTSGNFGIALAGICRSLGIRFIPVIDPNISRQKEQLLRLTSYRVIKVTEKDDTGGYLLTRIKTVKDFLSKNPNCFSPNQYENPDNYLAYYHTLGGEICSSFQRLDYVFISVSSCGTIIGLSRRLKEKFPAVKVIAVDVEGSLIFQDAPKPRVIPGMGAAMRSPLLDLAYIDKVSILSQEEIVGGCRELLEKHQLFTGPSSGAAYIAARRMLEEEADKNTVALFISPDHGLSYLDNIYSFEWQQRNILDKVGTNEIFE